MRIWAWDNPEHQLKIEVFGLGGAIKDLAWGPESKRIVVCGAGTGMNARAFMWDTGSNLGEVSLGVLRGRKVFVEHRSAGGAGAGCAWHHTSSGGGRRSLCYEIFCVVLP